MNSWNSPLAGLPDVIAGETREGGEGSLVHGMTQWVCGIMGLPNLTPYWLGLHGVVIKPPLLVRIVSGTRRVLLFCRSQAFVSGTLKHWALPSTCLSINSFFIPYSLMSFLLNIFQCLLIKREWSPSSLAQHIRLSVYIFTISCLFPTYSVL